jgi:hypothetical protein
VPQAGLEPHWHVPLLQLSALVGSQIAHADPAFPQADRERTATQAGVPLPQQLLGQFVALQAPPVQVPPVQVCPAPHARPLPQVHVPVAEQLLAEVGSQVTQVDPFAPQAARARVWQVLPAQQLVGHDVASHWHKPPTQLWPPAQTPPVFPHTHVPEAEQ